MDILRLKTDIVTETLDENGFLILLHTWRRFDEKKYRSLVKKISAYAELLGSGDQIDRDVAACLFELWSAIWTALGTFSETGNPDLAKVRHAHSELAELLHNRVFTLSRPEF